MIKCVKNWSNFMFDVVLENLFNGGLGSSISVLSIYEFLCDIKMFHLDRVAIVEYHHHDGTQHHCQVNNVQGYTERIGPVEHNDVI